MTKPTLDPGRFDDMHGTVNDAYTDWDEGDDDETGTHERMADVAIRFFGGAEAMIDLVAEILCEAGLQADTGMLDEDKMAEAVARLEKQLKSC